MANTKVGEKFSYTNEKPSLQQTNVPSTSSSAYVDEWLWCYELRLGYDTRPQQAHRSGVPVQNWGAAKGLPLKCLRTTK